MPLTNAVQPDTVSVIDKQNEASQTCSTSQHTDSTNHPGSLPQAQSTPVSSSETVTNQLPQKCTPVATSSIDCTGSHTQAQSTHVSSSETVTNQLPQKCTPVATSSTDCTGSHTQVSTTSGQSPWSVDEGRAHLKELFGDSKKTHSFYTCHMVCTNISKQEKLRLQSKKFSHEFIKKDNWWLVFVEGEGMYCLLCKKHMIKHPQNNREVFAASPSVRFKHDAIKTHKTSKLHLSALETELVQRTSCFHEELSKLTHVEHKNLESAFSVAYFLMKEHISNRKFEPLSNFIKSISDNSPLQYFNHHSEGSRQEIFQTIGKTLKADVVNSAEKALCYGLLTDEVADISVTENLVTFIQFFDPETRSVETKFLSCQDILKNHESANAMSIKSLICKELKVNDLDVTKLTGFSSDGASVMVGKNNGVAALLRKESPSLINIHCVCHKLALSCTDTNDSLAYIKTIETLLRQLWQLFENSPKKMAVYLKCQMELKAIKFPSKGEKSVTRRLKKACRTRWLSFDAAVAAVKQDYEAILHTLSSLEEKDAAAHGLLRKLRCLKFLGTIYILNEVLPILSVLSKKFQRDTLNFSCIAPAVNKCKDELTELKEFSTPLQKLTQDIDSYSQMCSDIKLNDKECRELQNLLKNYIDNLIQNIDRRFSDTSEVVSAFNIFDPTSLPKLGEPGFKEYGDGQVSILAEHFFDNDTQKDKLKAQWTGFKYHCHDFFLPNMPDEVLTDKSPMTPTMWLLLNLLRSSGLRHFNPELTYVAEAAASLPISNAWPERGASVLKLVKTKHRNRLSASMLEGLMHVAINGPSVAESKPLISKCVQNWLAERPRRKLAKTVTAPSVSVVTQTETASATETDIRADIRTVIKELMLEGFEPSSSDSDSDDLCSKP